MAKLHAHIESRAVDCDGPLDRSYTEVMNDDELADELMGEYYFEARILRSVISLHPHYLAQLEVVSYEDGTSRLSWFEPTEEGSRNVEATFCREDRCDMGSSQRDHYAEQMGY